MKQNAYPSLNLNSDENEHDPEDLTPETMLETNGMIAYLFQYISVSSVVEFLGPESAGVGKQITKIKLIF